MEGLLQGYANSTLSYAVNILYNNKVRDDLAQWYKGKRSKRLSPSVFPPNIRDELHVMEEIMVGCNTWNLARAWNTTFAYDALDSSPNAMMGLFSTAIAEPPMGNMSKPHALRERFLRFIGEGKPSILGDWEPYGNKSLVLEKGHTVRDIYDNKRCHWWVDVAYERWQKDAQAENWCLN